MQWSDDFLRLRAAWAATPSGRGGAAALAGFDFQLNLALVELIRRYRDGDDGTVLMEALSDVLAVQGDKLIVTQAKRTLTSGTLSKALVELWSIDRLAHSIAPQITNYITYRVVAAQQVLLDWEASRDRWQPSDTVEQKDLQSFKSRLTCSCEQDPRLEAAHLLILKFKDTAPLERIEKFVGRLVAAAKNDSFEDTTRAIALELTTLRIAAETLQRKFHL